MKHFKIQENYLLLKKWWESIDLTNYEKSFLNREIISFNQQLLRLKEKKLRIGAYGKSGVGKSSILNSLLKKDIFKTNIINGFFLSNGLPPVEAKTSLLFTLNFIDLIQVLVFLLL